MRLPTGDLIKTPGAALGILLESTFPGVRIKRGPERSLNTIKTGANSIVWHMAKKVVIKEDRVK